MKQLAKNQQQKHPFALKFYFDHPHANATDSYKKEWRTSKISKNSYFFYKCISIKFKYFITLFRRGIKRSVEAKLAESAVIANTSMNERKRVSALLAK